MMESRRGDLLRTDADALVNTVNCVGVMGRGVALQFKRAFPGNFKAYAAACKRGDVQPGRMFVYETGQLEPRFIINFPTKRHWRGRSRIEDIASGLTALKGEIRRRKIKSLALPPLGSGLGGLNWSDVRPLIEQTLSDLEEVRIIVFEPNDAPHSNAPHAGEVPSMTPGRAALVVLIQRYLGGLLDPFVTLLEAHKLMYFMQEAGEALRLKYSKAPFGPYAENLRHVLRSIEGHFISGYADGGDAPNKQLELVPGAIEEAEAFLADEAETHRRFDEVSDLVEGFESPFGLELLASVHWLASHEKIEGPDAIMRAMYEWNTRKRRFSRRQIDLAYDVLSRKGWLSVDAHS